MVRRIFTKVLTPKQCDTYTSYQELEAISTLHTLLREPQNLASELHRYALSVTRTVAFSKRVTSNSSQFAVQVRELMENFSRAMQPGKYVFETVPLLKFLPRRLQPWLGELEKYREYELEFTLRNYRDALSDSQIHPDRACLAMDINTEMEKAGDFNELQAATTCMEILGAGSETTATALQFIILALATNPDVVARAHAELDRVVGQDRFPTWAEDEPNLPYVRAIIKEGQRWRSISPLSKYRLSALNPTMLTKPQVSNITPLKRITTRDITSQNTR